MTAHKHPVAPVPAPDYSPVSGAGTNFYEHLITADASKVSGRDFLDAITGNSPEKREAHRQAEIAKCIRAIERGDTYGFPPVMVDECRKLMGDEPEPEGWGLAERSALGMVKP